MDLKKPEALIVLGVFSHRYSFLAVPEYFPRYC
jgi:hypothetical protein